MDESTATPSTSSSSAAAVADSASAAASNKTTAATAAAPSNTKATSIKLLIKASNQQFDDQIIESDLLWTVKRLKTQLSQVYPSKPPVGDQKLIYSGKLLRDNLQLKDVIRIYKDVYTQNHILHLVCNPKYVLTTNLIQKTKLAAESATMSTTNMGTNNTTADGLRQRHAAGVEQQQQQETEHQRYPLRPQASTQFSPQMAHTAHDLTAPCPHFDPNNSPYHVLPSSNSSQLNMQSFATQQIAMYNWMQQVYSQYMDQYFRLSNTPAAAANTGSLQPNPFFQHMPFMVPNASVAAAGTSTSPVIPFPSTASAAATLVAQPSATQAGVQLQAQAPQAPQAVAAAAAVEPAQQQQQQRQVVAPRFPNIVQEEQDNRDWLDSFFSITRLAIFLTILYFNSSPIRCLLVILIAGGIYLYHIGVLRFRIERNNNNINRNNNAEAEQIRQGVQQVQAAQAAQQQQQEIILPNREAANGAAAALERGRARPAGEGAAAAAADPLLANQDATTDPTTNDEEEEDSEAQDNGSVISFVQTFVVTFFTSLLPETPTAL